MSLTVSKFLRSTYGTSMPDRVVPRVPALRALHGTPLLRLTLAPTPTPHWFRYIMNYSEVEFNEATGMVKKANGHPMKVTKWLSTIGVAETKINEIALCGKPVTIDLTLTTSLKDMVRVARTRHWSSCWNTCDVKELLTLPHFALAVKRDKHGDFEHRWALWWDQRDKRILLNPCPYPLKNNYATVQALTDKLPVCETHDCRMTGSVRIPDISRFYTSDLYNEMKTKSNGLCQQISIVPCTMKPAECEGTA